ncbi:MAG: hypothetical protein VX466_13515 [Myxococcota bacterium]|nr:hypothetical protein [Myxococcota bacterium]
MKNSFRLVARALLLAAVTILASSPAAAIEPVGGQVFTSCGKWVLKLHDFGKLKIRDYNEYVPENLQQTPEGLQPTVRFFFGPQVIGGFINIDLDADEFAMTVVYPDQQGDNVVQIIRDAGTFKQKGRKLKFELLEPGVDGLQAIFADLGENKLFGERALVTDIPYVNLRENTLKFKGRIKNGGRFKAKFKTRVKYDIQYLSGSIDADTVDAKGVFKLRSDSRKCDG